MAKKSRRARLSPTQRYIPTPGQTLAEAPDAPVARPAPTARPSVRGPQVSRLGQNPEDYAQIRADLQRIGILAGSILTILVALRIFVFRG